MHDWLGTTIELILLCCLIGSGNSKHSLHVSVRNIYFEFEFALIDYTLPSFLIHTFHLPTKWNLWNLTEFICLFTLITGTYSASDNIKLIITIYSSGSAWMCRMHCCWLSRKYVLQVTFEVSYSCCLRKKLFRRINSFHFSNIYFLQTAKGKKRQGRFGK